MILETLLDIWRNRSGAVYRDAYVARFETTGYCRVMATGNLSDVCDTIIQREIQHHQGLGRDFEWTHLSCDEPIDMLDRLISAGFSVGEKEVVCTLDLSRSAMDFQAYRVERVVNDRTLDDFRHVAEAVFAKDFAYTTGVLAECLRVGSDAETGFVAYDGDLPVSMGRLSRPDGAEIAGLYTGGTIASHRGRGYYRSVVDARARYARTIGVRWLSVDARPASLPILLRVGFSPVVEAWPCDWACDSVHV